jgi:3-hydroxyacyl-[acyl-carrier-protein] dehydratase
VDYEELVRKNRKRPLASASGMPASLDVGRAGIERIIPHRAPFLLVDRLTGIDLETGTITGERVLSPSEPVFQGHFPGYPLYPGTLQVETIGQLGLCLWYFLSQSRTSLGEDAAPVDIRATRILGAAFLEPVPPGARLELVARKIEHDGFFARVIGQVIVDSKVTCVAVGEVVFVGDLPSPRQTG